MIRIVRYFTTLLAFALLAACGGGGGSSGTTATTTSLFTTAPATLTLGVSSSQQFTVGGGRAPYTAVSSNSSVVVPSLSGTQLTLGGVSAGSATVTLRDAAGATQNVSVTVAPAQALASGIPTGLVLAVGSANAQSYTVSGGVAPYTVASSNSNVLSASVSGNRVMLTGLAAGSANVVITDAANATVTVPVTVSANAGQALFTTAPSAVTVAPGSTTQYSVGGGVPGYTATSSNTSVATVSVSGNTLSLRGVAVGTASVLIRDSAGSSVTLGVTVQNSSMSLNPAKATTLIGLINYAYIIGGTGPYTAISGFPTAVSATIGRVDASGTFTADTTGNVLRMVANQSVNPAQVVVTDSTGNSVNFELTATAGSPVFTFAPGTLQIGEGFAGDITLLLYGGTAGQVNVFTTVPGLVTVTTPVTVGSSGSTAVTVHATGAAICSTGSVVITAVDSTGASATANISIVDNTANNAGCP